MDVGGEEASSADAVVEALSFPGAATCLRLHPHLPQRRHLSHESRPAPCVRVVVHTIKDQHRHPNSARTVRLSHILISANRLIDIS